MNSLLLDSRILLWSLAADRRLSKSTERLIATTPRVYISAVSLFELRAKAASDKLRLPDDLEQLMYMQSFSILDLSAAQLRDYRIFSPQNTDPFDNALLTIAEAQRFRLLTADTAILSLQKTYPWIVDGS